MAYMDQTRKATLVAEAKKVLSKYNLKATFKTSRGSIYCTITAGPIDFISNYYAASGINKPQNQEDYVSVNVYHIGRYFSGIAKDALIELKDALNTGNWDRSDISTDYFDVGWYVNIDIGKWKKPFKYIPQMAKATKMTAGKANVSNGDYDVSLFTFEATTKTFVTEASTLGWAPGRFPKHVMMKGKTKKVLYVRTNNRPDSPDAFYVPTKNSLDWTPACVGTTIVVRNT